MARMWASSIGIAVVALLASSPVQAQSDSDLEFVTTFDLPKAETIQRWLDDALEKDGAVKERDIASYTLTSLHRNSLEIIQGLLKTDSSAADPLFSASSTSEVRAAFSAVTEQPNYRIPFALLATEMSLSRGLAKPGTGNGAPNVMVIPATDDQRKAVIQLVANLLWSTGAPDWGSPDAWPEDNRHSGHPYGWWYASLGHVSSSSNAYNPDWGVCGAVSTGFEAAITMGMLQYDDGDYRGALGGSATKDQFLARFANVCLFYLVESVESFEQVQLGTQGITKLERQKTAGISVDDFVISRYRGDTGEPALHVYRRKSTPHEIEILNVPGGISDDKNLRNPYSAASCGFSLITCSNVLATILSSAAPDQSNVGCIRRTGESWKATLPDNETYEIALPKQGEKRYAGVHITHQTEGKTLELDQCILQLLDGLVNQCSKVDGNRRKLNMPAYLPGGTELRRAYHLYAIARFFKAAGYPYVIANWPWYETFCDAIVNDTAVWDCQAVFGGLVVNNGDRPLGRGDMKTK